MKPLITRKFLAVLRRWRNRRASIDELKGLSDQALRDIGLHRGEISSVVETSLDTERAAANNEHFKSAT